MLLVAAAALWALAARELWRLWSPLIHAEQLTGPAVSREAWRSLGLFVGVGLGHGLIVLAVAFVAIRMRRPRPPLRELLRQPGVIAVLVTAGLLVIPALVPRAVVVLVLFQPGTAWAPILLPSSILGAWAVAVATGWLRPERGWIDRLGCVIGLGWSLLGVSYVWLLVVF